MSVKSRQSFSYAATPSLAVPFVIDYLHVPVSFPDADRRAEILGVSHRVHCIHYRRYSHGDVLRSITFCPQCGTVCHLRSPRRDMRKNIAHYHGLVTRGNELFVIFVPLNAPQAPAKGNVKEKYSSFPHTRGDELVSNSFSTRSDELLTSSHQLLNRENELYFFFRISVHHHHNHHNF